MNKKLIISLLKISVSLAFIYTVFQKIPFGDICAVILKIKPLFLIAGFMLFLASQYFSAWRLQKLMTRDGYNLHFSSQLKLYLVGMFYNFFIPGGIGGDAYKAFHLNQKFNWPLKKMGQLLFFDRLSGLLALIFLASLLIVFGSSFSAWRLAGITILSVLGGVAVYFLSKTKQTSAILALALFVQLTQILSVAYICQGLGVVKQIDVYLFTFLLSAVLSLISFSGIGVREWFFLKSAEMFHYDGSIAVSIGLTFTFITAVSSFLGLFFIRNLGLKKV